MNNVDQLTLQKTDLDLNTSGALPTAPVDVGLGPDSLSPATRKALTDGYQTDTPDPSGDYLVPPRYNLEAVDDDKQAAAQLTRGGFLGRSVGNER